MNRILICLCLGVALLVGSCALVPNPIDRSRKKRALEIAADLKAHREASRYYRKTTKLVEVEKGYRFISAPKMEIWYSEWPLGPKVIVDVFTGEITYYD